MIIIKSPGEIDRMAVACRIVAEVLDQVAVLVRADVPTIELDRVAEELIRKRGGRPAFKGYRGYPRTLCVSVNDQVVHGIPGQNRLKEGDLVSVDVGVIVDGFFGDAARSYVIGEGTEQVRTLVKITEKALECGVNEAKTGNRLSDISHAIQSVVEANGFSVVRDFVGHGIGRSLHEDPQIPNYGAPGKGPLLKPGMTLAIEPMVNAGGSGVRILADRWTAVTLDGKPSAHFEHTVVVTDDGPRILTQV